MYRRSTVLMMLAALLGIGVSDSANDSANAFTLGYSRGLSWGLERIEFTNPVLAPFAHTRFCLQYPEDCRVQRMAFRGGKVSLTDQRWSDLVSVNAQVNRSIRPEPNLEGVIGEKWLISPKAGDCNDYAVTKRHELLARGWPSRSLLLAEVVVPSGEHHLVVVVRAQEGDLILDNLNSGVRPWFRTPYRFVRIQSPGNPSFWAGVGKATA
jgi:predicted transglutaminase-like cysteine proteinase